MLNQTSEIKCNEIQNKNKINKIEKVAFNFIGAFSAKS